MALEPRYFMTVKNKSQFDRSIEDISVKYNEAMATFDKKIKGTFKGKAIQKLNSLLKTLGVGLGIKLKSSDKATASVNTAKVVYGFVRGHLREIAEKSTDHKALLTDDEKKELKTLLNSIQPNIYAKDKKQFIVIRENFDKLFKNGYLYSDEIKPEQAALAPNTTSTSNETPASASAIPDKELVADSIPPKPTEPVADSIPPKPTEPVGGNIPLPPPAPAPKESILADNSNLTDQIINIKLKKTTVNPKPSNLLSEIKEGSKLKHVVIKDSDKPQLTDSQRLKSLAAQKKYIELKKRELTTLQASLKTIEGSNIIGKSPAEILAHEKIKTELKGQILKLSQEIAVLEGELEKAKIFGGDLIKPALKPTAPPVEKNMFQASKEELEKLAMDDRAILKAHNAPWAKKLLPTLQYNPITISEKVLKDRKVAVLRYLADQILTPSERLEFIKQWELLITPPFADFGMKDIKSQVDAEEELKKMLMKEGIKELDIRQF